MLNPCVTRVPQTPSRTILPCGCRTGAAWFARRTSDHNRLKAKGVTAIITAERGDSTLTRQGLEEYVSDCVILLDHRATEQISTRRLRIVKYRGSHHGTNEYPFLIHKGIVVLPITSIGLENVASTKRISSGIPQLDALLGGKGFYRGSSVLVSGTPGTGKTSLAAAFADAACKRGERAIYFAFEESASEITRNMQSIGVDLQRWVKKGALLFYARRPTAYGLETHLATMHQLVDEMKPSIAILDPISNLTATGDAWDVYATLLHMIDSLKNRGVTSLCTSLTEAGGSLEHTAQAFIARRRVGDSQGHGIGRRSPPRAVRAEVSWDAAFQQHPRTPLDRHRDSAIGPSPGPRRTTASGASLSCGWIGGTTLAGEKAAGKGRCQSTRAHSDGGAG